MTEFTRTRHFVTPHFIEHGLYEALGRVEIHARGAWSRCMVGALLVGEIDATVADDRWRHWGTLPTHDVAVGASSNACGVAPRCRAMTWLESPAAAICGYVSLVGLTLVLGWREVVQRRRGVAVALWPAFWFTTTVLLVVMAIGRASDTGELLADLGRRRARSAGWYETRRSAQAAAIGAIATIWAIVVLAAVWRVPERRRRYLPTALAIVTLVAFAGARIVSLHQVDALLDDRNIVGLSVGAFIELSLIALVFVVAVQQLDTGSPTTRDDLVPAESRR
jgi:hypothetical protein